MADDQESNNPFLKNYIIKLSEINNKQFKDLFSLIKRDRIVFSDKISRARIRKENGIRVLKAIKK